MTLDTSPLAVVTGASSGIGLAIAHRLAARGYRTVLVARRHALLASIARELSAHAPSTPFPLDLADVDAIAPAAARIEREHGPAHVLVNCAGFGVYAPFLDQAPEEFDRLLRVNFDAAVRLTRALLPGMLAQARRAHVVNIASMSARMGPWGHAAYAASKGALKSFTESMHAEHARHRVGFSVVYPGIVATPYFEKGSMARLWPRVAKRAVSAGAVADAAVGVIGTRRVAVYVPRLYRALDWIAAASPSAAAWLVWRESRDAHAPRTRPAHPPVHETPATAARRRPRPSYTSLFRPTRATANAQAGQSHRRSNSPEL